jgi:hypothetical protein
MFLAAVWATQARAWPRLAPISASDDRMAVTSSVMRAAEGKRSSSQRPAFTAGYERLGETYGPHGSARP